MRRGDLLAGGIGNIHADHFDSKHPEIQGKEHLIDTAIIVALIGVVGTALGIWFRSYLRDRTTARGKRAEAAAIFLATITEDAMSALTLAVYVCQNLTVNVRAIDAFRPHVASEDLGVYAAAEKKYYAACEPHRDLGPLQNFAVDLSPTATSDRQAIISAIQKLREFAK